jgi:hypothetical protein
MTIVTKRAVRPLFWGWATMTMQQAIEAALRVSGAFIQRVGDGDFARWVVLGSSYPGHSRGVFQVLTTGQVKPCF